eukprot:1161313-Pelagomonas_calceolata.AAC.1
MPQGDLNLWWGAIQRQTWPQSLLQVALKPCNTKITSSGHNHCNPRTVSNKWHDLKKNLGLIRSIHCQAVLVHIPCHQPKR